MRKRGRPREFDQNQALQNAMQVFWRRGYSATSLDDLSTAMSMNRPSIYNAFGTKQALYRQALSAFCGQLDEGIKVCLEGNSSLRDGLNEFFDSALDMYCANDPPMGCLMVCTAPAESLNDDEVNNDFRNLLVRVDRALEKRISKAINDGELSASVHPRFEAMSLQSTLQGIALRARAGESKRQLKKFVRYAVDRLSWVSAWVPAAR